MKTFHCDNCGQQVFFENTHCGHCGSMLGYQPEHQIISSFEAGADKQWHSVNPINAGRIFKQCSNYAVENVCNWMLESDADSELCASCQLTRIIPSLSSEKNRIYWQRLEAAKRRLLHSLWTLKIQPSPKLNDPDAGLAFEFLEEMPEGPHVLTGHANGVITLNIAEADPARREKMREQMHEPYRTLLGHFRHESGHYYFDRLIADSHWLEPFRALFGDERQDYGECLQRHYDNGPAPDWDQYFVSSYASSHPWEDWAESWAHYLHMFDTLETAHACGVQLKPRKPLEPELVITAPVLKIPSFDETLADWFALTYVLNSLNRSIGMPDSYPFTLSTPVLDKLRFIHDVVRDRQTGATAPS
jgi:hypothetical protein